jgi:hypothetical protein
MQGVILFVWVLKSVTKLSDRLLISSPYKKTKFRGLGIVQGQNCLSKMHRPQLYRLQYQKKLWDNLKKFWRKKMFSLKSMTKLEDLTVVE